MYNAILGSPYPLSSPAPWPIEKIISVLDCPSVLFLLRAQCNFVNVLACFKGIKTIEQSALCRHRQRQTRWCDLLKERYA